MRLGGLAVVVSLAAAAVVGCGGTSNGMAPGQRSAVTSTVADTPTPGLLERYAEGLDDVEQPMIAAFRALPSVAGLDADVAAATRALQTNPLTQAANVRAAGEEFIAFERAYVELVKSFSTPSPTAEQMTTGGPIDQARVAADSAQSAFETACAMPQQ